jgi:hypothetical protein
MNAAKPAIQCCNAAIQHPFTTALVEFISAFVKLFQAYWKL